MLQHAVELKVQRLKEGEIKLGSSRLRGNEARPLVNLTAYLHKKVEQSHTYVKWIFLVQLCTLSEMSCNIMWIAATKLLTTTEGTVG